MNRNIIKTIGILGGMGPEATALFFQKIVQLTPAENDQDHIKIVIYNNPEVPDRTGAILKKNESPVAKIKEGVIFLANSDVDFITIPCVTAHYFFKEIITSVNIPVLNMVSLTVDYIKKYYPERINVGVLATIGTYIGKIIESELNQSKLKTIIPDMDGQKNLMESIYGRKGIKAGYLTGYSKDLILTVADDLIRKGADIIIGGCTEIPLALKQEDIKVPFIDSLAVLAEAAVVKAGLTPKPR